MDKIKTLDLNTETQELLTFDEYLGIGGDWKPSMRGYSSAVTVVKLNYQSGDWDYFLMQEENYHTILRRKRRA